MEEEEPILKYERLALQDGVSALAAHSKFIAVATARGRVHVLTPSGDEIKLLASHTDEVLQVNINAQATLIASASADLSVSILDLWENNKDTFYFTAPVHALALHPLYPHKEHKYFITGTRTNNTHNLINNSQNYFGHRKKKINGGELPVDSTAWAPNSNILAFATNDGVRIYDVQNDIPIAFIPKPQKLVSSNASDSQPNSTRDSGESMEEANLKCCLAWRSSFVLIIGWGNYVQIIEVQTGARPPQPANSTPNFFNSISGGENVKIVKSLARFRLDGFYISGIAPFENSLLALCVPFHSNRSSSSSVDLDDKKNENGNNIQSQNPGNENYPEVLVVSEVGEILSYDAIPISDHEKYKPSDYELVYYGPGASNYMPLDSSSTSKHQTIQEISYYIVSPKDVVICKIRDIDDHISFLLQHGEYKKALSEAVKYEHDLKVHNIKEIEESYLDHLISTSCFDEAAALCPKLFQNDKDLWVRWIELFSEKGQTRALAPYIPTESPKLSHFAYGIILRDFLISDHVS
jgi:WD40 repeat protein